MRAREPVLDKEEERRMAAKILMYEVCKREEDNRKWRELVRIRREENRKWVCEHVRDRSEENRKWRSWSGKEENKKMLEAMYQSDLFNALFSSDCC